MELNELTSLEAGAPPTDTRYRPDQHLFEQGHVELAEMKKMDLESRQREVRKEMVTGDVKYEPRFFSAVTVNGKTEYVFKNSYWEQRLQKQWERPIELW